MNENKTELILKIARELSDESCAMILARINRQRNKTMLSNEENWDETKHPRDDDGRFAPGGFGRASMTKKEAEKWDKVGTASPSSKKITKIKSEIAKLEKKREKLLTEEVKASYAAKIAAKQRELAEAKRDRKQELRLDLEDKVSKRIQSKKIKEYQEIDEEIDYMEEKFADRRTDSSTQNEVVFPQTKKGLKAKARYEKLVKRRAELDEEIEWEKAPEDNYWEIDEKEEEISGLPPMAERLEDLNRRLPKFMRGDQEGEDEPRTKKGTRRGKGQTITEICEERIEEAKKEGDREAFKKWTENLKKAKEIEEENLESR